jgi:hypothetical protein
LLYARDGQHYSPEIDLLQRIDRFGVAAILGRPTLYYKELNRLIYAENLVAAYRLRAKAANWGTWADENPTLDRMLIEAELLCPML